MTKYEKDEVVIGYVTGIEKYGIFVNLDEYYNGLIHISEISPNFVRNVNDYVNIGETIKMRILSVDEKNHKVKLSIKNLNYKMRKRKRAKTGRLYFHGNCQITDTLGERSKSCRNLLVLVSNCIFRIGNDAYGQRFG